MTEIILLMLGMVIGFLLAKGPQEWKKTVRDLKQAWIDTHPYPKNEARMWFHENKKKLRGGEFEGKWVMVHRSRVLIAGDDIGKIMHSIRDRPYFGANTMDDIESGRNIFFGFVGDEPIIQLGPGG